MKRGSWGCCSGRALWRAAFACVLLAAAGLARAEVEAVRAVQAHIQPDGGTARTEAVSLPFRWDKVHPGRSGAATFRFAVRVTSPGVSWALYFPRIGNQAEVWVNGSLVTRLGQLGDPAYDAAKAPRLVELGAFGFDPAARPDFSVDVEVRTTSQPSRWGGLTTVYAGPTREVLPLFQTRYHWRQYGALVVSASMTLIALISLGVWWTRREPAFGVFAGAALAGALRFGDRLIHEPPVAWPWWGAINAMALVAYVVLMAWFSMLLADVRRAWLERVLLGSLLVAMPLAATSFVFHLPMAWNVALGIMALPSFTALALVLRQAWTARTREAMGVSLAGLVVILAGFRDYFDVRLSSEGAETFSILPHASLLFVLLLSWVVVDRYARHAREHHELLLTLESKVKAREQELEVINQRLREEHGREATLLERQRIMRDIHDGVGAQLVGLLNLIHKEAAPKAVLEDQARGALDELRMAVDALQPVHDDLATVLATLRFRLQPRLADAGVQVDWRVEALPPMPGLTPNMVLQIQRILLEAFTNVMRHARATRLEVSARFLQAPGPMFLLVVQDNGVGPRSAPAENRGLGLSNMQARAGAIGATLEVSPVASGGTRVELSLPLLAQ